MKKKALVVDDNANNLLLERDLLELANFEVFIADNATDGMDIARKEKPDIIISRRLITFLGFSKSLIFPSSTVFLPFFALFCPSK